MSDIRIGGHGEQQDPIAEAQARGADLAQFFLGDPQGWKGPEFDVSRAGRPRCARPPRTPTSRCTCTRRTC